jgi:hypothetical protein
MSKIVRRKGEPGNQARGEMFYLERFIESILSCFVLFPSAED